MLAAVTNKLEAASSLNTTEVQSWLGEQHVEEAPVRDLLSYI